MFCADLTFTNCESSNRFGFRILDSYLDKPAEVFFEQALNLYTTANFLMAISIYNFILNVFNNFYIIIPYLVPSIINQCIYLILYRVYLPNQ